MSQTENRIKAAAELLERTGLPASEALEIARESVQNSQEVRPGSSYGGIHAYDLAELWSAASRSGAKRLVLEIKCDPPEREEWNHLFVTVLEREDWNG